MIKNSLIILLFFPLYIVQSSDCVCTTVNCPVEGENSVTMGNGNAHCPRVVSTRQVRNSQFFSIFGRLWPRQECPCWPTNFKGGQFLSTNFTFVTWSYITKYFKMHHGIMPRPCLIMFLSKCDQEKHFHVACLGWEVDIFFVHCHHFCYVIIYHSV